MKHETKQGIDGFFAILSFGLSIYFFWECRKAGFAGDTAKAVYYGFMMLGCDIAALRRS